MSKLRSVSEHTLLHRLHPHLKTIFKWLISTQLQKVFPELQKASRDRPGGGGRETTTPSPPGRERAQGDRTHRDRKSAFTRQALAGHRLSRGCKGMNKADQCLSLWSPGSRGETTGGACEVRGQPVLGRTTKQSRGWVECTGDKGRSDRKVTQAYRR